MNTPKTAGTILRLENLKKSGRVILGIDPGLKSLGIGIIEIKDELLIELKKTKSKKKEFILPDSFLPFITGHAQIVFQIKTQREISEKLFFIFDNLCKIIQEYDPVLIMLEDAFVGVNKSSALKLGLSRGSILAAIGKFGKEVQVISPKEIKRQVTQKGNAEKEELEEFFRNNLQDWKLLKHDSCDALGAAFCGINKFLEKTYI
jgi:crossover junction endodeoxyribonuclease RuvC